MPAADGARHALAAPRPRAERPGRRLGHHRRAHGRSAAGCPGRRRRCRRRRLATGSDAARHGGIGVRGAVRGPGLAAGGGGRVGPQRGPVWYAPHSASCFVEDPADLSSSSGYSFFCPSLQRCRTTTPGRPCQLWQSTTQRTMARRPRRRRNRPRRRQRPSPRAGRRRWSAGHRRCASSLSSTRSWWSRSRAARSPPSRRPPRRPSGPTSS